jgi:hypothetical protein
LRTASFPVSPRRHPDLRKRPKFFQRTMQTTLQIFH